MAELLVLLHGSVVGSLRREQPGDEPTFAYRHDYVRDGTVALSAQLPLRDAPYPPARVAPYLAGLLPENRETRERWSGRLGTDEDDWFSILSLMGWDCPGAVQFCRADDLDELTGRGASYEPVDEAAIAQRLRALAADPASWTMPDEHWSLGGQQEKLALARVGGTWHEARGGAATTHIVKPGIRALHHQALVEHATMAAAAALGVDIARTQLTRFEDPVGDRHRTFRPEHQ